MKNTLAKIILGIATLNSAVFAAELLVPAEYPTIQDAIYAAVDGDTVTVAPGRYTDPGNYDIDFAGRKITVRSTDPNDPNIVAATIIDCNGTSEEYHLAFIFNTSETSASVLAGFTITNGYAYDGAAIFCYASCPTITNCVFTNNYSEFVAGAIYIAHSNPTITRCIFRDNSVEKYGGVIYSTSSSKPVIINCTFTGNSSEYNGGAIYFASNRPTVSNCTFTDNLAANSAGAVYFADTIAIVTASTLTGNFADKFAGAVAGQNSYLTFTGCAFTCNASNLAGGTAVLQTTRTTVTNCTFAENISAQGSGFYCDSVLHKYPSTLTISGSIFWDNGTEIVNYDKSPVTITYSDIRNGFAGKGNINADPLFRWPGYWDTNGTPDNLADDFWVEGSDFRLSENSPCINTGDPNYIAAPGEKDLSGLPRIIARRIDIGAREFNHVPHAEAGPDQTVEAQAPWGAKIRLDGSGSNDADSTLGTNDDIIQFNWYKQIDPCNPNAAVPLAAGPILDCNLPLGTYTFILKVTDMVGESGTDRVTIIVQDTTPPIVTCPADITLEATCPAGAAASFEAAAADLVDTQPVITYNSPPGSMFPLGKTSVTCTATDDSGNKASCSFTITVVDTTPPTITCPADITLEAISSAGVPATFAAAVVDLVDTQPSITYSSPPGSMFPLGKTSVICTATDASGNKADCGFTVTVVDTTPPAITCPTDITLEGTCPAGAVATFAVVAIDLVDPQPVITYNVPSGAMFPLGTTLVTCTAVDTSGNKTNCSFAVTVVDTTPPQFTLSVTPTILWPLNKKITKITPSWTVTDLCDPSPTVFLKSITITEPAQSNDPKTRTGTALDASKSRLTFYVKPPISLLLNKKMTKILPHWLIEDLYDINPAVFLKNIRINTTIVVDDIQVNSDSSIYLRACRSANADARIYTITFQAVDDSGNIAESSAAVTVPHDNNRPK
jgi:predicted outer membrane repeat protein